MNTLQYVRMIVSGWHSLTYEVEGLVKTNSLEKLYTICVTVLDGSCTAMSGGGPQHLHCYCIAYIHALGVKI